MTHLLPSGWSILLQAVLGESCPKNPIARHGTSLALGKTPTPMLRMDAYLAAFATRSGFQLVTADKALSCFNSLDLLLIEKNSRAERMTQATFPARGQEVAARRAGKNVK
jgi:hypothetical protein